jgi:hypothetical protein
VKNEIVVEVEKDYEKEEYGSVEVNQDDDLSLDDQLVESNSFHHFDSLRDESCLRRHEEEERSQCYP